MLANPTTVETITLTPAAVQAVKDIFAERSLPDCALRLFVSGGGCSGISYGMALEQKAGEHDLTWEAEGVKMVVDEYSLEYLKGASVDYVVSERGTGFKIDNPNEFSTCGCGDSACGCH